MKTVRFWFCIALVATNFVLFCVQSATKDTEAMKISASVSVYCGIIAAGYYFLEKK